MLNFLLGAAAGGLIAGVATIAAARHPGVQVRLGLVPAAQAAPPAPPAAPPEARCPTPAPRGTGPHDLEADQFFSRRRFWYVTPTP